MCKLMSQNMQVVVYNGSFASFSVAQLFGLHHADGRAPCRRPFFVRLGAATPFFLPGGRFFKRSSAGRAGDRGRRESRRGEIVGRAGSRRESGWTPGAGGREKVG